MKPDKRCALPHFKLLLLLYNHPQAVNEQRISGMFTVVADI